MRKAYPVSKTPFSFDPDSSRNQRLTRAVLGSETTSGINADVFQNSPAAFALFQ